MKFYTNNQTQNRIYIFGQINYKLKIRLIINMFLNEVVLHKINANFDHDDDWETKKNNVKSVRGASI